MAWRGVWISLSFLGNTIAIHTCFFCFSQENREMDEGARVFRLQGDVQKYAWGRPGRESMVAKLYKSSTEGKATIDSAEPYAEVCQVRVIVV